MSRFTLLTAIWALVLPVCASVQVDDPPYSVFFRNQQDAALRVRVTSDRAFGGTVSGRIGGQGVAARPVKIDAGETWVKLPFDPSLLRAGTYPWKLSLAEAATGERAEKSGDLRVLPRLDPDAFKIMSWGGWTGMPPDYLKSLGINLVNLLVSRKSPREVIESGMFVNFRVENSKAARAASTYDLAAIKADARRLLEPYEGLHTWRTTLVNSEVYGGAWIGVATNLPSWRSWAQRDLGFEPVFPVRNPPLEIDYKARGLPQPKGVLGDDPALKSVVWFERRGMPPYLVNAATREVVRELSPGNIVWSEPPYGGVFDNLDAGNSWIYDYPVSICISNFRRLFARVRPIGKLAYPTLAEGYWHNTRPPAHHPSAKDKKTGKPLAVRIGQSADELEIKSWLAVAAMPAEGLSHFSADTWYDGERNAETYRADPSAPVKVIAEPGSSERYGRFVRERFLPAAELLRNMTNAPALFAVALPSEVGYAGGHRWTRVHYVSHFSNILGCAPASSDFLFDGEITSDALARFRYVFFPMLNVVTPEHDAAIRAAAAKGVKIAVDTYCSVDYPGAVRLPTRFRAMKGDAAQVPPELRRDFLAWYETLCPELRAAAFAVSDRDGEEAMTFVKEHGGAKYVVVVNFRRREGGSIMNEFCTEPWYRPLGAPQRIVTELRAAPGTAVYDFTDGGRRLDLPRKDGALILSHDYAAAEAKVLAVYPRPLVRMDAKAVGNLAPGGKARLGVAIRDDAGHLAPGRQIVELRLKGPDGVLRDESGRYTAEGGKVIIPLRFASDEQTGTWTAELRELTTGLTTSVTISVGTKE